MPKRQTIEVVVEKHPTLNAAGITIPFDVEEVFGAKRVPVTAKVNGAVYRGSIVRMGGRYMLGFPQAFRAEAGIEPGETVTVMIEKDESPRVVEVPEDLASAIKETELQSAWDALSYTHQKEHARAIEEAKRPETRQKRIEKAIEMLRKKGT